MAILYEINGSTGGGHEMLPDPEGTPSPTEESVVDVITNAGATNDNVASLFGIQKWSNVKRIRVIYNGTIGHTGIGTWVSGEVTPSDETDWWENDLFMLLDNSDPLIDGYDTDFSIKVDPSSEPVTLGGYIIDTASYSEVTPVGTENPQEEGWYEESGGVYTLTTDTTVVSGKTYYRKTGKLCIRFANYIVEPTNVKIAVDITITRTDVG